MSRSTIETFDSDVAKRVLHWGGGVLALLGVIFVALRLREHAAQVDIKSFATRDWIALSGLAAVYGAANLFLALAWRNLLDFSGAHTTRRWAIHAYGISQLAKYVPGNIFHFAGRQALGVSAGIASWPLARSSIWELGLMSAAGALFAIVAAPLVANILPPALAAALFGCALVCAWAVPYWRISPCLATAMSQQASFLLFSGVVFLGVLAIVASELPAPSLWPAVCGAYVVAWLAGLVTPGAPAGIGVREVVLLFLLGGIVGESDLLVSVVLARMTSIVGDGLFFFAAFWIKPREADA